MNGMCHIHWVNVLFEFGNLLENGVYLVRSSLRHMLIILKP